MLGYGDGEMVTKEAHNCRLKVLNQPAHGSQFRSLSPIPAPQGRYPREEKKGGIMKRFHFSVLMIAMLLLASACAGVPEHMLFKDDPALNVFNIKPEKGKAALVVARTFSENILLYGARPLVFDNYLDKKMIGVSNSKGYFVKTDVVPGVHYVIAISESMEPVKINFEAQRIYYIMEFPRPGMWRARIAIALVTPEELGTSFDDSVRLMVYDANAPGDDMSDKDYQEAVNDYERELKEGHHKDHIGYKGVAAKKL